MSAGRLMTRRKLFFWLGLLSFIIVSTASWRIWQGPAVDVVSVQRSNLVQNVVAAGRITAITRAQIGVEITGTVLQRHVKEGDRVLPGDLLLTLRSDELSARLAEAQAALDNLRLSRRPQALAALQQSEFELEQAAREAGRRRDLLKSRSIATELYEKAAQAEVVARARAEQARILADALAPGASEERILIERVKAAQAALNKTEVRAHFEGLVLTRQVEPGDQVQPGRVLFEIARAGQAEVLVPVDERNLGVLKVGQPATCIADAFADQKFAAKINFIAPAVDPQRGTIDVRLEISNAPDYLREDMTVTATITTARVQDALLVPNNGLRNVRGDTAQVLLERAGRAVERSVRLGLRGLMQTQVLEGLSEGELVIISPDVQANQRVRAVHVD